MELQDTINDMISSSYKERLRAEYNQLKIRAEKLRSFLLKWDRGELNFTPSCSKEILTDQLEYMIAYLTVLQERLIIEDISLD